MRPRTCPAISALAPRNLLLAGCLIGASVFTPAGAADPTTPKVISTVAPPGGIEQPVRTRRATLKQLSGQAAFTLRGTEGSAIVSFGSRADELVTRAILHLRYTRSPTVIVAQSHLKVFLNDEIVGVLRFSDDTSGRVTEQSVPIDPRFVSDLNRLKLQFIGHYSADCEDQLHSGLWAEVSGSSELELSVRPVPVVSDLSLLPEPFFDRRDLTRLRLPFVFARLPDNETLRAAAVAASWFGQLASWRGARFPAHFDQPPKGHAIVFASNDARPAFLADHPPADGPRLTLIENPADRHSKLLLVLGRHSDDLKVSADALALGSAVLSGPTARVEQVQTQPLRQAYDAPSWVRTDRPTRFGELVSASKELQAFGHSPDLIRIPLRIPPDLFTWRSRGVPMDVKYRHNAPPMRPGSSRLTVTVNDELVRSFELEPARPGADATRLRLPLIDQSLSGADAGVALLPAFTLGARNQLEFGFSFGVPREGACRDTFVPGLRGEIDPDSTVDFSGFPHYAALPHLGLFASSGFPFTRFADLSQTIVVMPKELTTHDIEVLLTLMGRMGESTGHPAIKVRIASPDEDHTFADADLLVIGAFPQQPLLSKWTDRLPAVVAGTKRALDLPIRQAGLPYSWLGLGSAPDPAVFARTELQASGPLRALLGFESPLAAQRSVVVVTASAPEEFGVMLDTFEDSGRVRAMRGSTVLVHPNKVESFFVGGTYYVGGLPLWTEVWYHLSRYPLLGGGAAIVVALGFALFLRRVLRLVSARRMRSES